MHHGDWCLSRNLLLDFKNAPIVRPSRPTAICEKTSISRECLLGWRENSREIGPDGCMMLLVSRGQASLGQPSQEALDEESIRFLCFADFSVRRFVFSLCAKRSPLKARRSTLVLQSLLVLRRRL